MPDYSPYQSPYQSSYQSPYPSVFQSPYQSTYRSPYQSLSSASSPIIDIDEGSENDRTTRVPAAANVHSCPGNVRGSNGGKGGRGAYNKPGSGRRRTNWNAQLKEKHLEVLIECKHDGLQMDGSMKKEAFTRVRDALVNMSGGADIDEETCRTRYYTVHGIWRCWLDHLSATPGWGRGAQGVPVNDGDVMDEYYTQHPDRTQFRGSRPEFYDLLVELFGEKISTTGSLAIRIESIDAVAENDGGDSSGDVEALDGHLMTDRC